MGDNFLEDWLGAWKDWAMIVLTLPLGVLILLSCPLLWVISKIGERRLEREVKKIREEYKIKGGEL